MQRLDALSVLYDRYEFMKGDADFEDTYISGLDYWNSCYQGYAEIVADIIQQVQDHRDKGESYWFNRGNSKLISDWANETDYTYTITFECRFFDSSSTLYASKTDTKENIVPGQSYGISIPIPEANRFKSFIWEIRLDCFESDIQFSEITNI